MAEKSPTRRRCVNIGVNMLTRTVQLHNADFRGCYYEPDQFEKAVIVLTGSDGGIKNADAIAKMFARHGIAALAIAYFRLKGLPRHLSAIRLETIEHAANWLLTQSNGRITHIAIYGMSKGAEMALISATLFESINCVVASVPSDCINEGIGFLKFGSGTSSWIYGGRQLAYAHERESFWHACLKEKQIRLEYRYRYANVSAKAVIPVEAIKGDILFLSAADDAVWPSKAASERMMQRLKLHAFPYRYEHISYDKASHLLMPVQPRFFRYVFEMERKYGKACAQARCDSFKKAVAWIKASA